MTACLLTLLFGQILKQPTKPPKSVELEEVFLPFIQAIDKVRFYGDFEQQYKNMTKIGL